MSITPPSPDDPFGGLTASGRAVPEVSASKPFEPPPGRPTGMPGDVPRERWPVPVLVVLTVAGLFWGISTTDPPLDTVTTGLPSVGGTVVQPEAEEEPVTETAGAPTPAEPVPAQPQEGALGDGGSLWKPANLKVALAAMRRVAGNAEKIVSLRVDTDYLVAEYARGKQRIHVYANRDGRVDKQNTRIGSPTDTSIGTGRVDPTAPDRVARRIARMAGVSPSKVDYVVLSLSFGDQPQWIGFLDQESDYDAQLNPFFARLDGTGVKANGPKARR
jgi:hypothetical protein